MKGRGLVINAKDVTIIKINELQQVKKKGIYVAGSC